MASSWLLPTSTPTTPTTPSFSYKKKVQLATAFNTALKNIPLYVKRIDSKLNFLP